MSWQQSHLVENSWWPLFMSLSVFLMILSFLSFLKGKFGLIQYFLYLPIVSVFFLWLRDVSRESLSQGSHSRLVVAGLKWSLTWFLFSEAWFFFSIFWSFFHLSMSPITTGSTVWPLFGLAAIPPFQVPLLNTVLLLMSGVTVTLAHHDVLSKKKSIWLLHSTLMGIYFLALQTFEYYYLSFSIASSAFGSLFFMGTGFHGFHVFIGSFMLLSSSCRLSVSKFSSSHHFFLEFSLWYWHFVDVVWLFLFSWVYIWVGFK